MAVAKMKLKAITTGTNNKQHSCSMFISRLSTQITDDYYINQELMICLDCKESMLVVICRERVNNILIDSYVDDLLLSICQPA
jgi:hypothetical protein